MPSLNAQQQPCGNGQKKGEHAMSDFKVQGREWDSFNAYLFDIDGTLLHCRDAVHYFGFCEVLSSIAGKPVTLEGVTAHGNVDVGILRDALAYAGVPEAEWRPRLPAMREHLCRYVEAHKAGFEAEALPGVRAALEHLRAKGAMLGIATGNLATIGRAKLEHTGLWEFFTVGGWSDEYETRADVFRNAVAKMKAAAGANASICVLGDTPVDVAAARANGVPVIAVATGIYSADALLTSSPDLLLSSFEDLTLVS